MVDIRIYAKLNERLTLDAKFYANGIEGFLLFSSDRLVTNMIIPTIAGTTASPQISNGLTRYESRKEP